VDRLGLGVRRVEEGIMFGYPIVVLVGHKQAG
jgi:hypothetical protein